MKKAVGGSYPKTFRGTTVSTTVRSMPTTAVHPLETVRRGCFDWWTVAVMLITVAGLAALGVLIAL